jgi:hypothetical protein
LITMTAMYNPPGASAVWSPYQTMIITLVVCIFVLSYTITVKVKVS